jgi:hypothetical protein
MTIIREEKRKVGGEEEGAIFLHALSLTVCHVLVSFSSVYLVNCIFIVPPERARRRSENAEWSGAIRAEPFILAKV